MKNIKNINLLALFIIGLLSISCQDLVEDTNFQDDPNTVGSVPTVNLISQTELVATYLAESDHSRYSAIMSNSISGAANQWLGLEQYAFTPQEFNGTWTNLYNEGLNSVRIAKEQSIAEDNADGIATASMFEAYILGELATTWGDVPDSEAIANNDSPSYDSQAMVLARVQQLLSDAITTAPNSTLFLTDSNGSTRTTSTLGKIAHSLKARYYMITKQYDLALTEAQNGISTNGGGLISQHTSASGAQNMWYNFTRVSRNGDTTPAGSYLFDLVNPTGPVNRRLATPGEAERFAFYYRPAGSSFTYNNNEGGIFANDAPLPIISWYENQLILAEAAYRTQNETGARTALNAVRTALATQYGGDFPASTASGNELLLHILEEKYITIYPSAQTFHDITRTDNALGVRIKFGSQQPQRFLYPQVELDVNPNTPSPIPGLFVSTPINQ